jgi:transcriptional regulator with XRE-family HTH domain
MSIKETFQQENDLNGNIKETLIYIRDTFDISQVEIATRLGYKKNYFSKVLGGFSNGSPQLLAGLLLLKEVIQYEREADKKNEIRRLRDQIAALEKPESANFSPGQQLTGEVKDQSLARHEGRDALAAEKKKSDDTRQT